MPEGNPFSFLWELPLAPVYGLAETASNIGIPGANELLDTALMQDVGQFRFNHPGWTTAADLASFLVPATGWARATAGGAGALGAITRGAANLGGTNPTLRFALGETARWAPFNIGINTFDALGGRFDSAGEYASSFATDQALSFGLGAAGASPSFQRMLQAIPFAGRPISVVTQGIFGPSPETRALYGFGEPIRNEVGLRNLAENFDTTQPYQLQGRQAMELLQRFDAGEEIGEGIEREHLVNLIDYTRREGFNERPVQGESYLRLPTPTPEATRNFLERSFRSGRPLVQDASRANDSARIGRQLSLPEGWEFLGRYYTFNEESQARRGARRAKNLGLQGGTEDHGFRRIERQTEGGPQIWSIRQEHEGMWLLATELPAGSLGQRRFLQFKTDMPDFFFPENQWMRDIDNPNQVSVQERVGARAWDPVSAMPDRVSPFVDSSRRLLDHILSTENFQALARSARNGGGGKSRLVEAIRGTSLPEGLDFGHFVESYLKPGMWQFRNSPRAARTWQALRAIQDAGEAHKQELVYGRQSLRRDQNILRQVFNRPEQDPGASLYSEAHRLLREPEDLEAFRRQYFEESRPLQDWEPGPAKEFYQYALNTFRGFHEREYTPALTAIGGRPVPPSQRYMGLGRSFLAKGTNFYAIRDGSDNLVALGGGRSTDDALRDAQAWIEWQRGKGIDRNFRVAERISAGDLDSVERDVRRALRADDGDGGRIGGFYREREQYKTVDDLVSELDRNYTRHWNEISQSLGDHLTRRDRSTLLREEPEVARLLQSRIESLRGIQGEIDRAQNQVADTIFGRVFGTNSATKIVQGINTAMHHLTFGAGNISYPLINMTSLVQTSMAEHAALIASADDEIARMFYFLPTPGANGRPRGVSAVFDSAGALNRAFRILRDPSDQDFEVFQRLQQEGVLGPRFTEEYSGQASDRLLEGVNSIDDLPRWLGNLSNWMPAQSEKLTRTISAAMALDAVRIMERVRGIEFTPEQRYLNARNFVHRTNFLYATQDRPAIFTTPAGSLFGNMKNWMVSYINALGDYSRLATRGNFAPLILATGGLLGAGGLAATPLIGIADWASETFADQDITEFLYSRFGEGGNFISFGLPAALGVSISGSTTAPGSNLASDLRFLGSVPAWERMSNMASAVGRGWDDAFELGTDPWADPVFRQRMLQGFTPRSMYRALDVLTDPDLNSSVTGYPTVSPLDGVQRAMYGLGGLTPVEVERERAVYERLRGDVQEYQRQVALFGEAYFLASTEGDQDTMENLLALGMARGIDHNAILRSALRRSNDSQVDMFGRLLRGPNSSLRERFGSEYESALGVGGD